LAWGPPKCKILEGPWAHAPVCPMVNAPLFRGLSPLCSFFNIIGKQGNEKVLILPFFIWSLMNMLFGY